MQNNVSYDLTNLMIPAFGAMRMVVNEFNTVNGYSLEANSVTIESIPFRPQSVCIDASDVPAGETVTFTIRQINWTKIILGGNNITFNFPSIPNMIFDCTPSDGTSEVRAFFYNFPSFTDNAIQEVAITSGGVGADVNILSILNNGTFTQNDETVTNAADTTIAANAARKYLLIQNNDTTGDLYVSLAGAANPTAVNGFNILAGGSLELAAHVPANAITIRGSIASNPNVVIAEG
jgi:hypothetical protein